MSVTNLRTADGSGFGLNTVHAFENRDIRVFRCLKLLATEGIEDTEVVHDFSVFSAPSVVIHSCENRRSMS